MNARSLQEDLLSIPGVEGAEVEGTSDKPAGLRIRIAEGADQAAVGGAIRRVLTTHGLGTDTMLPGEATDEAPEPHLVAADDIADQSTGTETTTEPDMPPAAVAVIEDEDAGVIDLTNEATPDHEAETSEVVESLEQSTPTEHPAQEFEPLIPAPLEPAGSDDSPEVAPERVPEAPGVARIASVSVEEGRDGIMVTVSASNGSSEQQAAASSEGGVESAVIRASARLARPDAPEAVVVDVDDRRIEGVDIVMIVLDLDGEMMAGSAVVGAGRSFALGRATWAALSL